jgi:hypothetical protein
MPAKRDIEFRMPQVTYLTWNYTEMDRVLTMLFPRLKYDGFAGRKPTRANDLQPDQFADEMFFGDKSRIFFKDFNKYPEITKKWVETELLDVVNRGKINQAVAAPRPLHGETYKFRNPKHCRDYGTAEQIYWMIKYSRNNGEFVCNELKSFFFQAIDLNTENYDKRTLVDVETQALLRFSTQINKEIRDTKEPDRFEPMCIGRADIMAEDILKIMSYENYIPRSVMVEYLKTLLAFHLALYHISILYILPDWVNKQSVCGFCSKDQCPVKNNSNNGLEPCPYVIPLVVDMNDVSNTNMGELAKKSTDRIFRQIPSFVHANYVIKKLAELGERMVLTNKISAQLNGKFSISNIISLLSPEYDIDRNNYFNLRLQNMINESGDDDPVIKQILDMKLDDFSTFIEILMSRRSKYHYNYITQCLDSLLLKNKANGLLYQSRSRGSSRRFVLGSKLLEVLLQLAVLQWDKDQFVTKEIKIEDLLNFLKERYGLYIDRLPQTLQDKCGIEDRQSLRLNLDVFKRRLREIGFYEDLSDAYITQTISPRYTIGVHQ